MLHNFPLREYDTSLKFGDNMRLVSLAAFACCVLASPAFAACEDGHWVDSVTDNGEIVILEDHSIWQVDAGDQVDTQLWLPTTEIVACDGMLINTEDNEKAYATRIK